MRKIFHLLIDKLPERSISTTALRQDKWSIEGLEVILSCVKNIRYYENAWFTI